MSRTNRRTKKRLSLESMESRTLFAADLVGVAELAPDTVDSTAAVVETAAEGEDLNGGVIIIGRGQPFSGTGGRFKIKKMGAPDFASNVENTEHESLSAGQSHRRGGAVVEDIRLIMSREAYFAEPAHLGGDMDVGTGGSELSGGLGRDIIRRRV